MKNENVSGIVQFLIMTALICFLATFALMLTWNLSLPHILDAPELGFKQSFGLFGLFIVFKILHGWNNAITIQQNEKKDWKEYLEEDDD